MKQFKIIIDWFPFWQIVALAALNMLAGVLCFAGLVLVLSGLVG